MAEFAYVVTASRFRKSGKVQFQWLAGDPTEGILCTPLWALPRRLEPAAEDDMAVAEWPLTVSLHPQVAISLCSRRRAPDMTDQ
jgi:hypothetical protein